MEFPNNEPQITALANRMLSGYFWHAADFPSIPNYLRIRLFTRCRSYMLAKKALVENYAKLRIKTKVKDEKLLELKNVMKKSLQKASVDVADNPVKLKLIGWTPKNSLNPARPPGQPKNLRIVAKNDAALKLKWERPAGTQKIINYIIEQRQIQFEKTTDWVIIKTSYKSCIMLTNQPTGLKVEYRVRAANNIGTGLESNLVATIL